MMDTAGYALLKKEADCSFSMGDPKDWQRETVRVVEFNDSGSILVVSRDAMKMGMFDAKDIHASFKCLDVSGVLIPPIKGEMEKMMEASKRMMRKGGYNDFIKQMVIAASLHRNEFNDGFLFTKQ